MEIITLSVDTTVDENDGSSGGTGLSLRDAVIIAQQSPENEYIIELQGGATYPLSINGRDLNGGDLDLTNNITIRAIGEEPATIDASNLIERDRVIDVGQGTNITLENLIITGGQAEPSNSEGGQDLGGGIRIFSNSNVTILNSSIINNVALGQGGGIFNNTGSTLNLRDSEVSNNQSHKSGGGIINGGIFTIDNSIISSNQGNIDGLSTFGGGGISNLSEGFGFSVIVNSVIENNISYGVGGGIQNGDIDLTNSFLIIGNSEIRNNETRGLSRSTGEGGGIYNTASLIIDSSRITNNIANINFDGVAHGGGIAILSGEVDISETTISDNTTFGRGGGIHITGGNTTVTSSTISSNTADLPLVETFQGGGGVNNGLVSSAGIFRLVNSTVSGNVTTGDGGGINNTGVRNDISQQTIIINSTIVNNTANIDGDNSGSGGGVFNEQSNRLFVENTIIAGNFQSGGNVESDAFGLINGANNNLIGTLEGAEGTIGTGSDIVNPNVQLTLLQNNGGSTFTHALLEGSPAIDAGNNNNIPIDTSDLDEDENREEALPLDQLGNQRIINGIVDIGAVEFGSTFAAESLLINENNPPNSVYRFFNQDTGAYFYTASETERDSILEFDNFSFEGTSYVSVDPTGQPEPSPVYRFLNQDNGVHLYTISEIEKDSFEELDNLRFEGEAFSAYTTQIEGTIVR